MKHAVFNTTKLYCKMLFFRCILISGLCYVENSLHFNLAELLKQILLSKFLSYYCLQITKNITHHITEVLIFYGDKLTVMSNFKNLCLFHFPFLLKSRKFDARNIYLFYKVFNIPTL